MATQPTNAFDNAHNQDESADLTPASGVATTAAIPNDDVTQQVANMSIMTQTTSSFTEGEVDALAEQHADVTVENQRRGDDDADNLAGNDDDNSTTLTVSGDDSDNASTMVVGDDSGSSAVHHIDTAQDSHSMTASSADTPDDSFSSSSGDSMGSAGQDVFLLHSGGDAGVGAGGGLGGTEIAASTDGTGGADHTWSGAEQAPAGGDAFDTSGGMNFNDSSSSLPPIDTGGMGGGGF